MIFFVGSVKGKCFGKNDLIDSYNEYYEQQFQGQCFEARKLNFIVFDNKEDNKKFFYEEDEVGVYGDLANAFFKKNNDNISIYEKVAFQYKQNNINFLKELSGDFSFVLVDYIKKKIYLIRDQFGIKQLFWCRNNENIVFSNFLFSLKDYYRNNAISESFLKKYYYNNGLLDFCLTPYKEVYRVNVSSFIEIKHFTNMEQLEEVKYWNLDDKGILENAENEEQWVIKIDKLIENAIKRRNKKKVGIMLSGGLDSTTLFSYYAKFKETIVESFSAVFDELESCDERIFINELVKKYPEKEFNYVNCDDAGILEGYPKDYFYTSEPHVNIINKELSQKLFAVAKKKGVRYMVDGFFADHIFGGSIYYVMDKIKSGQYIKAIRAMRTYAETSNKSIWKVFSEEVLPIRKKKLYGITDDVIKENFPSLKKIKKYTNIDMVIQIRSTIARNFADFELAPRYGLECIHPYVDTELVEALYRIPGEFKCKNGVHKEILRKVAKNKLPELIVNREVKTTHVELSQKGLRDNWADIYNILGQGRICKLHFLSLTVDQWRTKLLRFRNGEEFDDKIWVLISMEIWLYQVELKYGAINVRE